MEDEFAVLTFLTPRVHQKLRESKNLLGFPSSVFGIYYDTVRKTCDSYRDIHIDMLFQRLDYMSEWVVDYSTKSLKQEIPGFAPDEELVHELAIAMCHSSWFNQ